MISAGFAVMLASGAVETPPVLAPSGQWQLEYEDNSCILSRKFGTGTDEVTFGFRMLPEMLSTDGLLLERGRKGARDGRMRIAVSPGDSDITSRFRSVVAKDGQQVSLFYVDADDIAAIAESEALTLTLGSRQLAIAPRGIKTAIAASKTCLDDLLVSWKIDPAINARVVEKAKPASKPQNWVGDDDYPPAALNDGRVGTVTFRLDIGADGKPAACAVLVSSRHTALDEATCALMMKRARFIPARTAEGEAVPYFFISRFNWRM